jgi:hypothetical protein
MMAVRSAAVAADVAEELVRSAARAETQIYFVLEETSVEHILPQNPEVEKWAEFNPDQRDAFTLTIGNLVLLDGKKRATYAIG